MPFLNHWNDGDEPPLFGVAVYTTVLPAQIVLPKLAFIVTDGFTVEFVSLTPLLLTLDATKHGVALDVITTYTESFATGVFNV